MVVGLCKLAGNTSVVFNCRICKRLWTRFVGGGGVSALVTVITP